MNFIHKYWHILSCLALLAVAGLRIKWEVEQLDRRVEALEVESKLNRDWRIERESWLKFRNRQKEIERGKTER